MAAFPGEGGEPAGVILRHGNPRAPYPPYAAPYPITLLYGRESQGLDFHL